MQRITKLTLKNFKGFHYQEFPIERRHTLVFGNNGAGKSSVYWSLHALLHSTTKKSADVAKYFAFPDRFNLSTHESLRNVFAPEAEDAYVEIAYNAPGQVPCLARIAATGTTTENTTDADLYSTFLASDFIHYRFLQDVFTNTNRNEIDLWPVFERDVFPYFSPDPVSAEILGDVWRELVAGPPKGPNGKRMVSSGSKAMKQFEQRLERFNSSLARFVLSITEKADEFLKQRFFGKEVRFRISVSYPAPVTCDELRRGALRNNRLPLLVEIPDPARPGEWLSVQRPQAFLNEAQLTRIALALRLGALATRLPHPDFQLLCLDDLLISLDMVNRQHVLDWLFDEKSAITANYHVFFFTHDRELFKMVRYYATSRQPDDWNIFELSVNDDLPAHEREPQLLTDYGNFYQQALRHYGNGDYAACANYLRKECERVLKGFLSSAEVYIPPRENGDPGFKDLSELIGLMKQTFDRNKVGLGVLVDLKWSLDSALNPLSHDSYGTTTYQSELRKLVWQVFPTLRELKGRELKALNTETDTFLNLTEPDNTGGNHVYHVRLHEPIRELVFPGNSVKIMASRCTVLWHKKAEEYIGLTPTESNCKTIVCLYDAIRSKFEATGVALHDRTLRDALPSPL